MRIMQLQNRPFSKMAAESAQEIYTSTKID